MAGFKYFGNKSWDEITREERYFCSHLYHLIIGKEAKFVRLLNALTNLALDENINWEIGYEVCFYRDYLKYLNKSVKTYRYSAKRYFPQKRTFDLCLFSQDRIIIIEAKAHQKLNRKQLDCLQEDRKMVKELLRRNNVNVKVDAIILHSKNDGFKDKRFDSIYWGDIFSNPEFKNNVLLRANKLYKEDAAD